MTDTQLALAIQESIRYTIHEYMRMYREYLILSRNSRTTEERRLYREQANRYISEARELSNGRLEISEPTIRQEISNPSRRTITRPQSSLIAPKTYNIPITKLINIPKNIPNDIPKEFICPITNEIMKDPVILTDGHIYEKSAIKQWLENHNTSPLTKIIVDKDILIPCFILRAQIEEYIEKLEKREESKIKSKRKPTEYNLYVKERMSILKQQNPDKMVKDIMKIIGNEWKNRN